MVEQRYKGLKNEVSKQLGNRAGLPGEAPKAPGLFDKAQDLGKAVGEKGSEIGKAIGEKGQQIGEKAKAMGEKALEKAKEVGRDVAEKAKAVGDKAVDIAKAPGRVKDDVQKRYDEFQKERNQLRDEALAKQDQSFAELRRYFARKTPFAEIYTKLPGKIKQELDALGLSGEEVSSAKAPTRAPKAPVTKQNKSTVSPPAQSVKNTSKKNPVSENIKVASSVVYSFLESKEKSRGC